MKRIILDTNFLIIPGTLSVDIFSEIDRILCFDYKLWVLEGTIEELKKLATKGKGSLKRAAKLGLQLLIAKNVDILHTRGVASVDNTLVEISNPNTDIVATQDSELKRRLKEKGVQLIVLRKKKYLNLI